MRWIIFLACPCGQKSTGRRASGYVRNTPTLAQQGAHPKKKLK
ncbi:MAG: hypothetical protein NZ519_11395 [Bacteroidia bacterium]|nr:hypothetical protein [Bacteroidia bacterium]